MDISSLRERTGADAMSVSELNGYIKSLIDGNRTLSAVTVRGEISNFKYHSSGHLYFSLKDEEGQIRAVMFRSSAARLKFRPESGMRVIAHGSVSVFVRDGSYQLYVNGMQPDGIGALYLAYEQLKEKLAGEGLFAPEAKRPIPRIPRRVGVITSPTGAAVRDIINVIRRRFPQADVYLYPALVQGDGAAESLIRAVEYFDASRLCDTVIIGRGGGSIEDLWAFNDERLARRIFCATVPVISAVGHETDFTICDFVADLRAPTPSAAAELAVPDVRELAMTVDGYNDRLRNALQNKYNIARDRLSMLSERISSRSMLMRIDGLRTDVERLLSLADAATRRKLADAGAGLSAMAAKLSALNPLSVISRGYAVVSTDGGRAVSLSDISVGDDISVRITGATIDAKITNITENGE